MYVQARIQDFAKGGGPPPELLRLDRFSNNLDFFGNIKLRGGLSPPPPVSALVYVYIKVIKTPIIKYS